MYVLTSSGTGPQATWSAMNGVFPSPEAAKDFARGHVKSKLIWQQHQQPGEAMVHFTHGSGMQWEIRQWQLGDDMSPAFEAAILLMATGILRRGIASQEFPLTPRSARAVRVLEVAAGILQDRKEEH